MHDSPAPGVRPPDPPGPRTAGPQPQAAAPPPGGPQPGPYAPGQQGVPGQQGGPAGAPPSATPPGAAAAESGDNPNGGRDDNRNTATRAVTVVLVVSLVLVVVLTGVVATLAVLMTRNPDAPPLSTVVVRRLQTPVHFAPVRAVKQAPCPGAEAVLDEAGTTCYQVDAGVTVSTVQKIETLRERNGAYAVRIVLSPESKPLIADLTRETVNRQLAVVVGDKVVTAPRVSQAITQDSLSISGLTKENADALAARLLGAATGTTPPGASPGATAPSAFPTDGTAPSTAPTDGTAPSTSPSTSPPDGTAPGTAPSSGASTSPSTGTGTGTGPTTY